MGGLVGSNDGASISSSYSAASVNGSANQVGGLVGYNGLNNNPSPIISSYATGNVNGSNDVGGLVGANGSSAITTSYAIGRVTGNSSLGGLIGNYGGGTLTNNYWDTQTSGQTTSGGQGIGAVEGKTTAQMKQQATFSGWDFASTWAISDGNAYPYLNWEYNVWSGSGLWSVASNWSRNVVPNAASSVMFDATNANPSSIDASFGGSVGRFYMHSGYAGTITQGRSLTLGSYEQAGGTYDAGANTIMITGDWEKTGGTFNAATSAVTFNGTGIQTLISGGSSFATLSHTGSGILRLSTNNLTTTGTLTNSAGTFEGDTAMDINGDFILTGGTVIGPTTVSVAGNWTNSGGIFTPGTGTVTFDAGSTGKTITSGGSSFYNAIFNNAAGGWTISGPMTVMHDFTLTNGAITQSANLAITHDYAQTGGTFTATNPSTNTFSVGNSFSITLTDDSFMRYTGTGLSAGAAYMIYDVYGLQAMQQDLDAYYKLNNNIDASGTPSWNAGAGFDPVGHFSNVPRFTGSFNGNSHTITGLTVNRPTEDYNGLFADTNGATIQNVGIINGSITGRNETAGLIGEGSGTITNTYFIGTVNGVSQVGGLVGALVGTASLTNSYSAGSVILCFCTRNGSN